MKATGFDDLPEFVIDANRDGMFAAEDAVKKTARAVGTELRRITRRNFSDAWRVWDGRGLSKSIRVRKLERGVYRVDSKAVYDKGRTDRVNLLWVFSEAPTVRSSRRSGVAVPIKGEAPIAANGRRYAWPRELEAMGWDLSFAPIRGKRSTLILGRRNSFEDWKPLYILTPSAKMPRRLDLDGLHAKHTAKLDVLWGEIVDQKTAKRARRSARS